MGIPLLFPLPADAYGLLMDPDPVVMSSCHEQLHRKRKASIPRRAPSRRTTPKGLVVGVRTVPPGGFSFHVQKRLLHLGRMLFW